MDEWSTKIELDQSVKNHVINIKYRTKPDGKSMLWTRDEDGKLCTFTAGSLINNRSFLPYQDAPSLMSTWQLIVKIPEYLRVLTTGDETGEATSDNQIYFYTRMILPLSTLALAIGQWKCHEIVLDMPPQLTDDRLVECHHLPYRCPFDQTSRGAAISTRIFASQSISISKMADYLPLCYRALYDVLGRHLVPKMDILVLPKSISYLGLTSPGLIFLSPTVFFGQVPMLDRLAHEISHSWFGVNIGPENWHEEWISEGFATFMEVYF